MVRKNSLSLMKATLWLAMKNFHILGFVFIHCQQGISQSYLHQLIPQQKGHGVVVEEIKVVVMPNWNNRHINNHVDLTVLGKEGGGKLEYLGWRWKYHLIPLVTPCRTLQHGAL